MNREVKPADSLQGTLQLPADKSISHRAAMFASLHKGKSKIQNFSEASDPHSTLYCLKKLGVGIDEKSDDNTIEITGVGRSGYSEPDGDLDCGNSGTTMRLLSGIIAGTGIRARLTGDESLSARTMKRIIDPLTRMGADIKARNDDFAPLSISRTKPLQPLYFPLPIPSAQLKSSVLLAGLFGDEDTEVIETVPSRDHTERLLKLPATKENGQTTISSSRKIEIPEQSYRIPNDFSAAAFWLAAGAVHPDAKITLPNVGMNPTRTGALDILKQMGAEITIEDERMEGPEPVADLTVSTSQLQPTHIKKEMVPNCIDEIPTLAVAMLFADGTSRISGAKELRHKETDRLNALADMLGKADADFEEFEDGLKIYGNPAFKPSAAQFDSFHDHRIAMSAAVLGIMGDRSSTVSGAECTAISYPSFWEHLAYLTN